MWTAQNQCFLKGLKIYLYKIYFDFFLILIIYCIFFEFLRQSGQGCKAYADKARGGRVGKMLLLVGGNYNWI